MRIAVDRNIPLAARALGPLGELSLLETTAVIPAAVKEADALVVRSETRVGPALLEGSRVRFVGSATIGTDHCDMEYLASRGIAFANAPGSNANSVKEYLLAALLELARRRGAALRGSTLGVVGVGNVGSRVAAMAASLGMSVLKNDPPLARAGGGKEFLPLDALMEADIVTLHVPLTKGGSDPTYHLFDARRLAAMKPGAILINTARGGVVDTGALSEALRSGHLSAAVADVWEGEPLIDRGLLRRVAIGTPHIAGYSMDGKVNAIGMVRAALCRHAGVTSAWDPSPDMPPPGSPVIEAPSGAGTEESLGCVVRAAYDLLRDDHDMRRLLDLPPAECERRFRSLRTGYRVRREFSAVRVSAVPAAGPLREALIAAGFGLA